MFNKICLIFLIFTLSGSLYAQCTKDIECKGDRICENGACIYPNPVSANKAQNQPDKKEKKVLSEKENKTIKEKEALVRRHLYYGKAGIAAMIITGILSDIVIGVGLGLYYNSESSDDGDGGATYYDYSGGNSYYSESSDEKSSSEDSRRKASYAMFATGGVLFLVSMVTLGTSIANFKEAGKYEKEIRETKGLAYNSKFITACIPTPIIYKNGKQELYGVSFKFRF